MSTDPLTMDDIFFSLDDEMHEQFFAAFTCFLEKENIDDVEFQKNEYKYIYKFQLFWSAHLMLLHSDDESYGNLKH